MGIAIEGIYGPWMRPNFDGEVGHCVFCGPCEVDDDDKHCMGLVTGQHEK